MASVRGVEESKAPEKQKALEDALYSSLHGVDDPERLIEDRNCLNRYLRAREWNVKEAGKMLKSSISWRQETKPKDIVCHTCKQQQGYHSMRQVGHDQLGRPVFYSSFTQATQRSETKEAAVQHIVYLLEQACSVMEKGADSCVWVMDCDGMFMSACNPQIAYGVNQVVSYHYPERLGLVLALNSGMLMRGAWAAIKPFVAPQTAAKLCFLPSPLTLEMLISENMGEELSTWLLEEVRLNLERPIRESQRQFWEAPPSLTGHDPRGCRSYVDRFLLPYYRKLENNEATFHHPHPNIVESLRTHHFFSMPVEAD